MLYSGRQGTDLVGSYNRVANANLWVIASDSFGNATVDGHLVRVHRSLIESGRASRLVWTWYWVSGEYTANPGRVRFLQAKARLLGRPATIVVISLGTDTHGGASETERSLQEFRLHASFHVAGGVPPNS